MFKYKDFRIPFTWENRRIMIHDGVWFLPPALPDDPFVFTGWDMLFSQKQPVKVEYCSGNGSWIVEKAKNDPTSNWLAVEKQFERARLIWARAKNEGLQNFALAFCEGVELTKRFFSNGICKRNVCKLPRPVA